MLSDVLRGRVAIAADVGAGFGRMTPVVAELAQRVVGVEREPGLLEIARSLQPEREWLQVEDLARLPFGDGKIDLAVSFTVLQHLTDADAARVCAELRRVVADGGAIVLCEETDPRYVAGDPQVSGGCTIGRAVATYAGWMAPRTLVVQRPRRIEPTYPRRDVGTYMGFR